jgi:hypothetical protein
MRGPAIRLRRKKASMPSASFVPRLNRLAWPLSHALAFGLAAAFVEATRPDLPPGWNMDAANLANRVTVALTGVFTSLAQGWLLRRQFRAWWAASLLGSTVGAGLALSLEWLLPDLPTGSNFSWGVYAFIPALWLTMVGFGQGLAQSMLLRVQALPSWRWALASSLRWFASLPIGYVASLLFGIGLVMLKVDRLVPSSVPLSAAIGAILGLLALRGIDRALRPAASAMPAALTPPGAQPVVAAALRLSTEGAARSALWWRWVAAHLAAYLAGAILVGLVDWILNPLPRTSFADIGSGTAAAHFSLVLGAGLAGLGQGLLLRRLIPGWWRASLLGALAGLAAAGLAVLLLPFALVRTQASLLGQPSWVAVPTIWLLSLGLILALAQWLALRGQYQHAAVWVAGSLLFWSVNVLLARTLSYIVGYPVRVQATEFFKFLGVGVPVWFIVGPLDVFFWVLSAAIAIGGPTGWLLLWVLQRPAALAASSSGDSSLRSE